MNDNFIDLNDPYQASVYKYMVENNLQCREKDCRCSYSHAQSALCRKCGHFWPKRVKCSGCNGSGRVCAAVGTAERTAYRSVQCRACRGEGTVVVIDYSDVELRLAAFAATSPVTVKPPEENITLEEFIRRHPELSLLRYASSGKLYPTGRILQPEEGP